VIWPGPVHDLLLPYYRVEELLREDLVATDVIRSYSISSQYQALINDLGACGFRERDDRPTLFVCWPGKTSQPHRMQGLLVLVEFDPKPELRPTPPRVDRCDPLQLGPHLRRHEGAVIVVEDLDGRGLIAPAGLEDLPLVGVHPPI
jgi:hypothetical protein